MTVLQFLRRKARGPDDDTLDCIALEYQQSNKLSTLPQRLYEEMCLILDTEQVELVAMSEEDFSYCKKMIDDVLERQFRVGIINQKLKLTR